MQETAAITVTAALMAITEISGQQQQFRNSEHHNSTCKQSDSTDSTAMSRAAHLKISGQTMSPSRSSAPSRSSPAMSQSRSSSPSRSGQRCHKAGVLLLQEAARQCRKQELISVKTARRCRIAGAHLLQDSGSAMSQSRSSSSRISIKVFRIKIIIFRFALQDPHQEIMAEGKKYRDMLRHVPIFIIFE